MVYEFDANGQCVNADSFRAFITNCHMHMGWWDYFGAGILGTLAVAISLLFLLLGGFLLFYNIPLNIGEWWANRSLSARKQTYYDFCEWKNFRWSFLATGYLIMFIVASGVVVVFVALFWLGHLFVLGQ